MKVMITGASGFLGSYIADNCTVQGDEVRSLVRNTSPLSYLRRHPEIQFCYGSLSDAESIEKATRGVDVVYHAAARSSDWGTYKMFEEANYIGTVNILNACLKNNVERLVYISSPSVVFDYKDEINISEAYPYPKKFANHYSETKAKAEQLVLEANTPGGLTTVALRPHAIWGPRDYTGFLPRILGKIVSGRFRIIDPGKEPMIDMCYAQNAADACILASKSLMAGGNTYFITDGQPVGIWQFMRTVCNNLNVEYPQKRIDAGSARAVAGLLDQIWRLPVLAEKYEPPLTLYSVGMLTNSTTYDISAARRDLKYEPRIDLNTGLQNLCQWIQDIGGVDKFLQKTG